MIGFWQLKVYVSSLEGRPIHAQNLDRSKRVGPGFYCPFGLKRDEEFILSGVDKPQFPVLLKF